MDSDDLLEILTPHPSPSHDSAISHVTGESIFVDDRPFRPDELFVGIVTSTEPHALIDKIDFSDALAIPGVVATVTAADLSEKLWGPIIKEQPIIASEKVNYNGEIIAAIAAESETAMRKALRAVKVAYTPLPPILSIEEAIAKNSFIGEERKIERGNIDDGFHNSDKIIEGELHIKGADHFALENHCSIAYPREGGRMEVHSSTQGPTDTQHLVAEACGLSYHEVVCVVKRLGGGFGGKETQASPFAAIAALLEKKTKRRCRILLTKDEDMIVTGKRNPFTIKYLCGFNQSGEIVALDLQLFCNAGAYADLSPAIMERAMLHSDNAYFIPNMRVRAKMCRTNYHPHTAFRGFGGPKGVAIIEMIVEEIARTTKKDALDIRKINCYSPGKEITHYGQIVENNLLPKLFTTLEKRSSYRKRRKEIEEWNRDPNNNPRGLALSAVKFGISFTTRFLNQGNALVNIHLDGTIQVSTGAVEMGQGVNQRIAAIVATEFGLPISSVTVMPTSTEKNANTSATAASSGTDINGGAAAKACHRIKERLLPLCRHLATTDKELWPSKTAPLGTRKEEIFEHYPQKNDYLHFHDSLVYYHDDTSSINPFVIPFNNLLVEAYLSRISLSAYAHYRVPNVQFNKLEGIGNPFLYFTQGVAASEVEIDQWTGNVKLLQTDILMDLGHPINYSLDCGQIAGAFIQGLGWLTTENPIYDDKGLLLTHSPSTYKIPSIHDTPRIFNIDLVKNEENRVNVMATKAVGEPPLLLSLSAWLAIRDAISQKRALYTTNKRKSSEDINEAISLHIPATAEKILRALQKEWFEGLA